jgi:hypothetical protein
MAYYEAMSFNTADLAPCVPDAMADGEDPLKMKLPAIAAAAACQPLFYDWVGTTGQLTIGLLASTTEATISIFGHHHSLSQLA